MPSPNRFPWPLVAVLSVIAGVLVAAQPREATIERSRTSAEFASQLVDFVPGPANPVFTAGGAGQWDTKIRERGWIMLEGGTWHMWYTGYDGTRDGLKQLGYATSPDGLHWTRYPENPLVRGHWVEDMMVVKNGDTYYMFAEGVNDEAQLLTSTDRVNWTRAGKLDIRYTTGKPLTPGAFGTPTAWLEKGVWNLFYERSDKGVWLATSKDLKTWTNVQDEPVFVPGPEEYDKSMIALNQVVKLGGQYYGFYHGSGDGQAPRTWNTDVVRSTDLVHWRKYLGNPIVPGNKSSGIVVFDGQRYRLYTMHEQVDVYYPREK